MGSLTTPAALSRYVPGACTSEKSACARRSPDAASGRVAVNVPCSTTMPLAESSSVNPCVSAVPAGTTTLATFGASGRNPHWFMAKRKGALPVAAVAAACSARCTSEKAAFGPGPSANIGTARAHVPAHPNPIVFAAERRSIELLPTHHVVPGASRCFAHAASGDHGSIGRDFAITFVKPLPHCSGTTLRPAVSTVCDLSPAQVV